MAVEIPLLARDGSLRAISIVDDEDAEHAAYRWQLDPNGYVARSLPRTPGGPRKQLKLHRVILGLGFGDERQGDHLDGERLNNRRSNLRVVTQTENAQNVPAYPGTSRHRGVSRTRGGRWNARIKINGRDFYLGSFANEEEAARVASEARLAAFTHTNEQRAVRATPS